MNKNRIWVIGAILTTVMLVAAGYFIGIAPQLAAASSANSDRANVMAANARNEILLTKLKHDYQNIDALKNQVSNLQKSVPAAADVSSFVTELNSLANARKVTLKSITVSDARAYTPTTQAVTTNTATSGSPQTNPKITTANFVTIPVTIGVTGDYSRVLDFVNDVQLGRRLFLVSTLSSMGTTNSKGVKGSPTTSGGSQKVDSSIAGYMYVLLN
jgi:Tfp pilus assembly protein PilO